MNFKLNINDIKKLISDSLQEGADMELIINPILEKYNLEKKEILEVCQIGKFIYKIDSEIRITEKPQPPDPDFIIEFKSKLIGLEHTRILTKNASRYFRIVTLLDCAEKIYRLKHPNKNVLATISIKNDELDYKLKEKTELAEVIADLVDDIHSGNNNQIPNFITNIRTTKHSQITFNYHERNWQSEYLTKERLKQEIQKKERKIVGYKKSKLNLSEFWLVLLIGSLSSASYILNENENYEMDSKFDRVYLMADFDANIIRIK